MTQLFARKPIADLQPAEGEHALKRVLGAGDLIMLAIGAVIGAGIFSSIGTAAAGEVLPSGEVVRYGAGPALVLSFVLLGVALGVATWASRRLGFSREDEITIVFCGSKKSLASGVPMAKVLFAQGALGMVILPLMLFHQIQLMVCAVLAQRWAKRAG